MSWARMWQYFAMSVTSEGVRLGLRERDHPDPLKLVARTAGKHLERELGIPIDSPAAVGPEHVKAASLGAKRVHSRPSTTSAPQSHRRQLL